MRKKSHISLAGYIVKNMNSEELISHKKAFFMGSVLPDCMPSFITKRHNFDETFSVLEKELYKVTEAKNVNKGITSHYCRRLGVITHYIADYFTFPHNSIFTGKLKEHCVYEKELKDTLRAYVNSGSVRHVRKMNGNFNTVDEICVFIKKMHQSYLKAAAGVKADCRYIVELCFRVVDAVLQIFELKLDGRPLTEGMVA